LAYWRICAIVLLQIKDKTVTCGAENILNGQTAKIKKRVPCDGSALFYKPLRITLEKVFIENFLK
jgi:hypothetical protein